MISAALSEIDLKKVTGLPGIYCCGFLTLCDTDSEPVCWCSLLLKTFFEGNAPRSSLSEVG